MRSNYLRVQPVLMLIIVIQIAIISLSSNSTGETSRNAANQPSQINPDGAYFRDVIRTYERAFSKVQRVYRYARERGIVATGMEIENNVSALRKLVPDQFITKYFVEQAIVIEKYLMETGLIIPEEFRIQRCYEELVKDIPESNRPNIDEIRSIVTQMAYLKHEEALSLAAKIKEEKDLKRYNARKKIIYWSFKELRIDNPTNECLAFDPGANKCLVDVQQFNAAAKTMNIKKRGRNKTLDSTRVFILNKVLSDIYLVQNVDDSGIIDDTDFMEKIDRKAKTNKFTSQLSKFGSVVKDETILFETYGKYYDELFCKKVDIYLDIIGSTDSLYIDSLHRWLCHLNKNDSAKQKERNVLPVINKLPWQTADWNNLPDELVNPTNSLQLNEFTKPVVTKYGYFIIRVSKIIEHDEKDYYDVHEHLTYLATRDKWENTDSIIEAQALNTYKKNRNKYVTPDTLLIKACLLPYYSDSDKRAIRNTMIKNNVLDTNSVKTLTFTSLALPDNTRKMIENAYSTNPKENNFIGPVFNKLGAYYFKVLKRKPGGRQLTFNDVQDEIEFELKNKRDTTVTQQDQEKYLKQHFIANAIKHKATQWRMHDTVSDDEVRRSIKKGEIDISELENVPEDIVLSMAKQKYLDNKLREFDSKIIQWTKTLDITKHLLLN